MKKLIALLPLIYAASALAAPSLYGDVEVSVTHCGMVMDGAPKVTAPVVTGGATQCKFDLATIKPGTHTATLTAIINDPVWGTQESAPSAPFTFTRPVAPAVPSTLKLAP